MFAIRLVIASCATSMPCDDVMGPPRAQLLIGRFLLALLVVLAVVMIRTRDRG